MVIKNESNRANAEESDSVSIFCTFDNGIYIFPVSALPIQNTLVLIYLGIMINDSFVDVKETGLFKQIFILKKSAICEKSNWVHMCCIMLPDLLPSLVIVDPFSRVKSHAFCL